MDSKSRLLFIAILFLFAASLRASPSYYCYKASQSISIDGKLDEAAWNGVPSMTLRHISTGAEPKLRCTAKMLWDEKYLYIGFDLEDTDIWALNSEQQGSKAKLAIMNSDPFVKIFLDPDSDAQNYMEIHVNPLNNLYQTWLGHGSSDKFKRVLDLSPENYHNDWSCEGLKKAVSINGTLNKRDDTDKSWCVEVAIPWSSLKRFCIASCPPSTGDVWRILLGRVERKDLGTEKTYFTSSVIGFEDCHQVDKWNYLIFSDEPAEKTAQNPSPVSGQLELKLAWVWSMENKPTAEIAQTAKSLGFNSIAWMLPQRPGIAEECHKAGMKLFGVVFFPSGPSDKKYRQLILPDEEKLAKQIKENFTQNLKPQGGGEPLIGGESCDMDFWCLERPETMEYAKKLVDDFLDAGYDGIAFDAIGYKNYYACFCPICVAKHEEFIKANPQLSRQAAIYKYSEQRLVSFLSELVRYTKEKKPDTMTTCHIWPNFAPNPLYGNKVPFDYCGQTVSWFFKPHWELDKVERYIDEVVRQGSRYHKASHGAPFITVWYSPDDKSVGRVKEEIRMVKQSGAKGIQFAELSSLLANPEMAKMISEELDGKAPAKRE
ncbi:MAG: hypothetical protein A2X49_14460 [Lentisphaerae bacterium GWF2_52_8]|nr:MAG: hypothetical protein A2X49_14460 [Lentisphaerae bacterium GWF2_52_8]